MARESCPLELYEQKSFCVVAMTSSANVGREAVVNNEGQRRNEADRWR